MGKHRIVKKTNEIGGQSFCTHTPPFNQNSIASVCLAQY